jgi:hypothetical protein
VPTLPLLLEPRSEAVTRRYLVSGLNSDGFAEPRLVFPKWRIAREATIEQLCEAFVDRARAENLAPMTQRYYRQTSVR